MYDQTIKSDKGKLRLTLVPPEAIKAIARAREYGVNKYGNTEGWKAVEIERYRDALFRHMLAYIENPQGKDKESGLRHLDHLICNAAFLCALDNEPVTTSLTIEQEIELLKEEVHRTHAHH